MDKLVKLFADIGTLWEVYWWKYFEGIGNTLILAVAATLAGCIIGLICGVVNTIPYSRQDNIVKRFFLKLVRVIVRIYVEVFRGTPMVLQAVFIFYGLPYFTDGAVAFKGIEGIWIAALLVVSINTGAYMAESVRGGIISIDPGQTEGAKAIGMTHVQTMLHVIMPQAIRNIIPQIGYIFMINFKDSSVLLVIGFVDFFATHRNIVGVNLKYIPSAVIEMVGYLTLTLAASFLLRWIEKKMDGSDTYELASEDALAMSAGTYSHPDRGTPFDEKSREVNAKAVLAKEKRERMKMALKNRNGSTRGDR